MPESTVPSETPLADGWFTVYYKGIAVYQFSEGTRERVPSDEGWYCTLRRVPSGTVPTAEPVIWKILLNCSVIFEASFVP